MECCSVQGAGVTVRQAFKKFARTEVLKGLNMTVQSSSIYALLGPSGCGKTTLLNCLVGRTELDSGTISIKTKYKSGVGYMPQCLALYVLLNIRETFQYYGRIYGMGSKEIATRTEELTKLLQLPDKNQIVETMSGGQQRRVSIAIALIHDPELIILDEPTVGVDPVLRESIWTYLLKACNEGKTIIITTHYIEEARQAHVVGLMRGGILLCEDTPQQIMMNQNCDTMEKAFFQLSYSQETSTAYCGNQVNSEVPKNEYDGGDTLKKSSIFSLSCTLAELVKNWFFIWRNKPMLLVLIGLPVVVAFLFNMAIGHVPKGLKLGIIDDELQAGLGDCSLDTIEFCNSSKPLSCRYIKKLTEKDVEMIEFADYETAREATLRNYIWGVLNFPSNYTESILKRIELNLDTPDDVVENGQLRVWMDMSNFNIGFALQLKIYEAFLEHLKEYLADCGWPKNTLNLPLKFNTPVYGNETPNLTHFASPGVIVVLVFYLPMKYTIGVISQEKESGVLERSHIAGVTTFEVLLSHSIIQIIVLLIQIAGSMFVLYYVYGTPFIGSTFWSTLLLLGAGLTGMALGFLISVFFEKMMYATFASMGTVITYFFFSGTVWPLEGLQIIPRWFFWFTPLAHPVEAMRAMTARGWGVTHPVVGSGFLSIAIWLTLFLLATHLNIRIRGKF